jgi:hypothetical protein
LFDAAGKGLRLFMMAGLMSCKRSLQRRRHYSLHVHTSGQGSRNGTDFLTFDPTNPGNGGCPAVQDGVAMIMKHENCSTKDKTRY